MGRLCQLAAGPSTARPHRMECLEASARGTLGKFNRKLRAGHGIAGQGMARTFRCAGQKPKVRGSLMVVARMVASMVQIVDQSFCETLPFTPLMHTARRRKVEQRE